MKLVIAEKPSVAKAIAEVLGVKKYQNGFIEGNDYLVSWCFGHLIEMDLPDAYEEKYKKWQIEDLPFFPDIYRYHVISTSQEQYEIIAELMKRSDVTGLICATDAGREGELIFRLVYEHAHCSKPIERLWVSSLEASAIRGGFSRLKRSEQMESLYQAAKARQHADYLVGMNLSRLYSSLYRAKLSVGRVQTPTLCLVVDRANEVAHFVSQVFYTLEAMVKGVPFKSKRFEEKAAAEAVVGKLGDASLICTSFTEKEKVTWGQALYDLTTLQRDANRAFGYSAQQTLDLVQTLYEEKKCTYPRTDSRYITEDMRNSVTERIQEIQKKRNLPPVELHLERLINNQKVTDHHAILLTDTGIQNDWSKESVEKRNLASLIEDRMLETAYPPQKSAVREVELKHPVTEDVLKASGGKVLEPGFTLLRPQNEEKEEALIEIPIFTEGVSYEVGEISLKEGKTSPPKLYTEDTLLSAMEKAGTKEIDKSLDVERMGLGTPATRASVIEELLRRNFMKREKKNLVPTEEGKKLIAILPERLKSAEVSAEWENTLARVSRGEKTYEDFIHPIKEEIQQTIQEAPKCMQNITFGKPKESLPCPQCQAPLKINRFGYFCDGCGFKFFKDNKLLASFGKKLTEAQEKKLLSGAKVALKGCISQKTGKPFDCLLVLRNGKVELEFQNTKK